MNIKPGIRYRPYLGLWLLDSTPSDIKGTPEYAFTDQERDGTGESERQIPAWFSGCPLAPTKRQWELSFETLSAADLLRLLRVQSWGDEAVSFCPWLPWVESFRAASGSLQRTSVMSAGLAGGDIPAGDFTPAVIKNRGETLESVTMGAIDSATGQQAWSGGHATLSEVVYVPIYRARLDAYKPQEKGGVTSAVLLLTEI